MEADNLLEGGSDNGCGGVGVAQGDEMRIFGEAIDHRQDHGFPTRLRKSLNEVHGDVLPDRSGNVERLKEPDRVQLFSLVALANRAPADEVVDEAAVVRREECGALPVQSSGHPHGPCHVLGAGVAPITPTCPARRCSPCHRRSSSQAPSSLMQSGLASR
jgi:hypothetical protein